MKRFFNLQLLAVFAVVFLLCNPLLAQVDDDCSAHLDDEMMHDEHCAVFALVPIDGATHVSITNGSWFNPSIWNVGTVPGSGANVFIDSATIVSYDAVSETEINWLRVKGTLNFSSTVNTKLKVTTIVTDPIAHMNIGSVLAPVLSTVSAKIIFSDNGPIDITNDPHEFGRVH